jgi:hypothetical protein
VFTRAAAVLTALTCVLAAGLVTAIGAPASAADSPLRLVAPQVGSPIPTEWTGPVEVDTTAMAEDAVFDLKAQCEGPYGYFEDRNLGTAYGDGPDQQAFSLPAPPSPDVDVCRIIAQDQATGQNYTLATFEVSDSPLTDLALSGATLSATYFYPRVVDSYRDTVALSWHVSRRTHQTVRILNSNSSVMRTATMPSQLGGTHRFTWNGRTNSGAMVAPGTYRIFVTARTLDGTQTRSFYRVVSVRTGLFYVRKSLSRYGNVSSASRSGPCFVERDSQERTTSLDCWGGRYARAAYAFRLPSNATRVAYAVSGHRNYGDLCCDGRITRTGERVTSTLFRVQVQVTGWRAYDVAGVRVSYTTRVRR